MIYLDYNATTPLSDGVKEIIKDNLDLFVNPSSMYNAVDEVKMKINKARMQVATLINCKADQIIFTSCATESNNSVISSCIMSKQHEKKHIIVSSVEHSAILEVVKNKCNDDIEVTYVPVDKFGKIDILDVKKALKKNTVLVSIMLVNNEIGNIYPVKEIANVVHKFNSNIKVHTDATQAIGKMKVDVVDLGVDYLTISAHKFHGPKGIGALYIKDNKDFNSFIHGGHQENNLRAGTENVLSIIAMGQAAEEAKTLNEEIIDRQKQLRDDFEKQILTKIKGSSIVGDIENRIWNTSCILVDGISGTKIVNALSMMKICISSGSACNSNVFEPSHVMKALNINQIPIRVSIGKETTERELKKCIQALVYVQNTIKR